MVFGRFGTPVPGYTREVMRSGSQDTSGAEVGRLGWRCARRRDPA